MATPQHKRIDPKQCNCSNKHICAYNVVLWGSMESDMLVAKVVLNVDGVTKHACVVDMMCPPLGANPTKTAMSPGKTEMGVRLCFVCCILCLCCCALLLSCSGTYNQICTCFCKLLLNYTSSAMVVPAILAQVTRATWATHHARAIESWFTTVTRNTHRLLAGH